MARPLQPKKVQPVELSSTDDSSRYGRTKGSTRGASSTPSPRQGTSRSYAERKAKGRPNVTVSMAAETVEILSDLAERYGLSRSAVVDLAIRELAKKPR